MPKTVQILILANSIRHGGYCVAGKLAMPLENGEFKIVDQWIRLTNPDGDEGAVPHAKTLCPAPKQIHPLDIIQVELRGPCNNPDHPEDWYYEPASPWRFVSHADKSWLPLIADKPPRLWHDGGQPQSVHGGFVRAMTPPAFSICLIPGPQKMDLYFWKKPVQDPHTGQMKSKYVRDLLFEHAGIDHEFSVTDPVFMEPIWKRMTDLPQVMRMPGASECFLCLSLGLEFHGRHYKICATIFER
jgi:hypothetical protein